MNRFKIQISRFSIRIECITRSYTLNTRSWGFLLSSSLLDAMVQTTVVDQAKESHLFSNKFCIRHLFRHRACAMRHTRDKKTSKLGVVNSLYRRHQSTYSYTWQFSLMHDCVLDSIMYLQKPYKWKKVTKTTWSFERQ